MLLRNPTGLLPYCPSDSDVGGDFDGGGAEPSVHVVYSTWFPLVTTGIIAF